MEAWQRIAETIITEHLHEHCKAVKKAQEEKSEQLISAAVDLVLDPNRYLHGISTDWTEDKGGDLGLFRGSHGNSGTPPRTRGNIL